MNDTEIDYCHKTWNPKTGCWGPGGTEDHPQRCWYCYAEQRANTRLRGRAGYPIDDPFRPTFHPRRLAGVTPRQKPKTIFVGSMADMWGPWVPDWQTEAIVDAMKHAPQHRYLLLTKSPYGYRGLAPVHPFWLGTTITGEDASHDLQHLYALEDVTRTTPNTWVSVEPYLAPLSPYTLDVLCRVADWVVIGALNRLVPVSLALLLETFKDPPPKLIIMENVPRITSRGKDLLAQIRQLLACYGYRVHESTHDCGELGGEVGT